MTLRDTELFRRLEAVAGADHQSRALIVTVESAFQDAVDITKTIVRHMPEYTLHDEVHLVNVVRLMGVLIPASTLDNLRQMELSALILAAAFHDIGMAPSEEEVRSLLSPASPPHEDARRYAALRVAHPRMLERQSNLRMEGRDSEAHEIEGAFLVDYLRRTHADRGRRLIFAKYDQTFRYGDYNFCARLADVCYSHNEDASYLLGVPCWELVRAPGEYCNWRFVGAVLRLADILDFDPKRTPTTLFEHIGVRDPVSVREWKKHRSIAAWDIRPGRVAFTAQCPDPVIEKCIREFVRMIEREMDDVRSLIAQLHDPAVPGLAQQYALQLPPEVDVRSVAPQALASGPIYNYVDLKFNLDEDSIIDLLMGVKLYRAKTLFLRELLQNGIDACRHRAALHRQRPELGAYAPELSVRHENDGGRDWIVVEDNGMGMDERIVRQFFARVGRSYYKSSEFAEERERDGLSFAPISQFGVGVLSTFMAGDLLRVETRRLSEAAVPLNIEIAGRGGLFWFKKGHRVAPGTSVRVRLNCAPETLWLSAERQLVLSKRRAPTIHSTVQRIAAHCAIKICTHDVVGTTRVVREKWRLETSVNHCESIDVDLAMAGHAGLSGKVRVFVLQGFQDEFYLDEDDYDDEEETEDLRSYLSHSWGHVTHVHVDKSVRSGRSEGFSTHAGATGRWSQQGINVDCALVCEHDTWRKQTPPPYVRFPAPLEYDIDLAGSMVLPLTVDRNSIVQSDEASRRCAAISIAIWKAFLMTMGEEGVRRHEDFFCRILENDELQPSPFRAILDEHLRAT